MNSINLILKRNYYEDYLRHIFSSDGEIVLTRTNEVGKYIYSRIRESDLPVHTSICKGDIVIKLFIPDSHSVSFGNKFIYFSVADVELINDFISAHFDMCFYRMMLEAEKMGYEKKDALEAFLFGLGLNKFDNLYETLKKREYRKEVEIYTKLYEKLRQKDYRYRAKTFVFINQSLQMVKN